MDIRQFIKRKSDSDKRLRTEVQPAQTNGVERVKRFVNVQLHGIVSNLKRIRTISTLAPLETFLRTLMGALISIKFLIHKRGAVWFKSLKNDKCQSRQFP